jgi:glycosyltransferase involved in cell wall biosynthesis
MAHDWRRPETNSALVRQLAAQAAGWTLHVAGETPDARPAGRRLGLLTRREDVSGVLGRAKTLACPSLVDASPAVLFEASAMGCNVVATRNCGNWLLCHDALLAERCTVPDVLDCIQRALARPYADHRDRFAGGYAELADILRLF